MSSSSDRRHARGLTLIELLVTLSILAILAAAALPYAELTVRRQKEIELRASLREIRTAIDRFHDDWVAGRIPREAEGVSEDGYPRTLEVLVDGVDSGGVRERRRYYLRRIPRDPFAPRGQERAWQVRGYQDPPGARAWSAGDVYDVRSSSERIAIDGTRYAEW